MSAVDSGKTLDSSASVSVSNSVPSTVDSRESSSSSSQSSDSDEDFENCKLIVKPNKSQPMQAKVNILANPDVVGALDRVNLPDRGATYVVNAVAKALGHDVGNMILSQSSIRRLRNQNREEATTSMRNESINNSPMLLH